MALFEEVRGWQLSRQTGMNEMLLVCVTGSGGSRGSPLEFLVAVLVVTGGGISMVWRYEVTLDR